MLRTIAITICMLDCSSCLFSISLMNTEVVTLTTTTPLITTILRPGPVEPRGLEIRGVFGAKMGVSEHRGP